MSIQMTCSILQRPRPHVTTTTDDVIGHVSFSSASRVALCSQEATTDADDLINREKN